MKCRPQLSSFLLVLNHLEWTIYNPNKVHRSRLPAQLWWYSVGHSSELAVAVYGGGRGTSTAVYIVVLKFARVEDVLHFMGLLTQLQEELPVQYGVLDISSLSEQKQKVGLVIVDEVNGFCTVGAGNLAPPVPNKQISDMVAETDRIAKLFSQRGLPILAFLDTHFPDKPEPPYPAHCVVGTGEENLVPELAWLESDENAHLMRKGCISGFIGAFKDDGSNVVVDWIKQHQIESLLVVGICTDICVLDFVLAIMSARNHDMLPPLKHVFVYSKACATYDLPLQVAKDIGAISHPQDVTHHMGLYIAAMRGANIVSTLNF